MTCPSGCPQWVFALLERGERVYVAVRVGSVGGESSDNVGYDCTASRYSKQVLLVFELSGHRKNG